MPLLALDFPPVSHVTDWPTLFGRGLFAVNKVVLLEWLAAVLVFTFFWVAARGRSLVPARVQNLGEALIEFVQNAIVLQAMGPEGMSWTPFLVTLFSFIFVCNIFEIIPVIQMPVTARIALPMFLALLVFASYHVVGVKKQGVRGYLKSALVAPGVPKAIMPLVTLNLFVEFVFTKPFSLGVRLFANLLAGHLLLVTFSVLTAALFSATYIGAAVPAALLAALYAFEVLVSVLQAFIFTMLAAVYIGGAMHPEH
jgi:F-type H+-transporting ATPase subunit a